MSLDFCYSTRVCIFYQHYGRMEPSWSVVQTTEESRGFCRQRWVQLGNREVFLIRWIVSVFWNTHFILSWLIFSTESRYSPSTETDLRVDEPEITPLHCNNVLLWLPVLWEQLHSKKRKNNFLSYRVHSRCQPIARLFTEGFIAVGQIYQQPRLEKAFMALSEMVIYCIYVCFELH